MKVYEGMKPNGEAVRVTVEGCKIASVETLHEARSDLPYILPPLVESQHNGALGVAYDDLDEAGEAGLRKVADCLRSHGVGRCLLTLTTSPYDKLKRSMATLRKVLDGDKALNALFFGIFHEGVFMSPVDGWRGAHAKKWLIKPNYDLLKELDDLSGNRVKAINVAPEEEGGLKFIERAVADGKMISLGHCCPSAEIVAEAVARGASLVTHFGNGAAPSIHRFKNPLWAYLSHPELRLGLICDGFHLPPELVSAALKCKGRKNCYPVSDAAGLSGLPPGEYRRSDGDDAVIRADGFLGLKGQDILAGAWFQQDRCVDFLVRKIGMSFLEAWDQCVRPPAAIFGARVPTLRPGKEASFVLARYAAGLKIERSVHFGQEYPAVPLPALK